MSSFPCRRAPLWARIITTLFMVSIVLAFASPAPACTTIGVNDPDGGWVVARTMEFGVDLESQVVYLPKGHRETAILNDNAKGLSWTYQHAVIGLNALEHDYVFEGFNDQGLHVGALYLPGYAQYQKFDPAKAASSLGAAQLPNWLLASFSNVAQVREGLKKIRVVPVVLKTAPKSLGPNYVPPVHWIVTDAAGRCLVIEYTKTGLNLYDNPLAVVTNSPTFDWHVTNLRNYVNLTALNVPPVDLSGLKIGQTGQGSGMLGLPGDFTPPSRFVRAVALSQTSRPAKTHDEAVTLAWNLINNINLTIGTAVEREPGGGMGYDYTQWVTVSDPKRQMLYFRTYENPLIRSVSLKDLAAKSSKVARLAIQGPPQYPNLTADLKYAADASRALRIGK